MTGVQTCALPIYMLELGDSSEKHHRSLGADLVRRGFELVVFVGDASRAAAEAAREQGMSKERAPFFKSAAEAGDLVAKKMGKGWRVLVKGSRRVALEGVLEVWERRVEGQGSREGQEGHSHRVGGRGGKS